MNGAARVALGLAGFVPVHFAFSAAYERLVLEKTSFRLSERQFEARRAAGPPVRTLALGDSHPRGAVDPSKIEDAFNFTSTGENAALTYSKLRWSLDAAPDVDVVVLPVDLHSFSSYRADRFERPALSGRYVDWRDLARTTAEERGKTSKERASDENPWMRSLGLAVAERMPYLSGADDAVAVYWTDSKSTAFNQRDVHDGFFGAETSFADMKEKDRRALAAKRAHDHFDDADVLDPPSVAYLRRSLALCASRHVRVALVRFPVTSEYWDEATKLTDPTAFYAEIASIAGGFEGVRVFDHHADFFGRDEVMRDADHVNVRGAAIFSTALAAEVESLRNGSR